MLTRKQAKKKYCAIIFDNEKENNAYCDSSNCPKWKNEIEEIQGKAYYCLNGGKDCQKFSDFLKIANNEDEELFKKEHTDFYFINCFDCENRFGRCGS